MDRFPLLALGMVCPLWLQAQPTANRPAIMPKFELKGELNIHLPADIELIRDVTYGKGGNRELKLDIIKPKDNSQEPYPAILWIHGGAWLSGNKAGGIEGLIQFAQKGYLCATIDYRLSKEATFPAQIEDCKAAVRFLRAQAEKYHLDPDRIGVWGSSAGGHLAALLGTSAGVVELEGKGGHATYSSHVQAVCDWFGPTDLLSIGHDADDQRKHNSKDSPESMLIGGPIQQYKDEVAKANPITYISPDDPPFLIMHGDEDPIVPIRQSEMLYEALQEAGVEVAFLPVQGAGHGAGFDRTDILETVTEFFDTHLKKQKKHSLADASIQPYSKNPYYWQYKGVPVVLIGGSKEDNLFQISGLEGHLDTLAGVGGNYIRNTMSGRDAGNVWPFQKKGKQYDLDTWNETYWQRFDNMLRLTAERDIIVQIEIWDIHDFYSGWERNPWNPANNVNYTEKDTRLKHEKYGSYWDTKHDFFLTVPQIDNNEKVLAYQQKFVDKLLSYSLRYPNVLYCMTNEIFTQYPPEWGWYWASYVKQKAAEAGVHVEVAEMYQNHDLDHEQHKATLDHPEIYSFIDISQNSRKLDQEHWDKFHFVRNYIQNHPRPINHTKTYGGDAVDWTDGDAHGIERFWRNIIAGAASCRFHRPPSGIGLNEEAQAHIKSMRMLLEKINLFESQPDATHRLLAQRTTDEAYLTYTPGQTYAVYFPEHGAVDLDLTQASGKFTLQWLDAARCQWSTASTVNGGKVVTLEVPGQGANRVAVLTKRQ